VAIHLLDMLEVRNYDSFIGHDISPTGWFILFNWY